MTTQSIVSPADSGNQLSLFGAALSDFPEDAPTSELPRAGYVRKDTHQGQDVYCAIDLVMWAKDEDWQIARQSLKDVKKALSDDESQLVEKSHQLKAMAPDNKMRKTDFVTREQALLFCQVIPGKKTINLKEWLAKVGGERLEEIANPGLGIDRAEKRYIDLQRVRGLTKTEALRALQNRRDGKENFKLLTEVIKMVCNDQPKYWQIVDAEYMGLFGRLADELKAILHTKSIRDDLPELQYHYVQTAEAGLRKLLQMQGSMTNKQIVDAARIICEPLGAHLAQICGVLSIDVVTGRKLIGEGK